MFVRCKSGEFRRGDLHATAQWQEVPDGEYFDHESLEWADEKPGRKKGAAPDSEEGFGAMPTEET